VVFDKLVEALVFGAGYERIADAVCPGHDDAPKPGSRSRRPSVRWYPDRGGAVLHGRRARTPAPTRAEGRAESWSRDAPAPRRCR
jgi:hypothetical protein